MLQGWPAWSGTRPSNNDHPSLNSWGYYNYLNLRSVLNIMSWKITSFIQCLDFDTTCLESAARLCLMPYQRNASRVFKWIVDGSEYLEGWRLSWFLRLLCLGDKELFHTLRRVAFTREPLLFYLDSYFLEGPGHIHHGTWIVFNGCIEALLLHSYTTAPDGILHVLLPVYLIPNIYGELLSAFHTNIVWYI